VRNLSSPALSSCLSPSRPSHGPAARSESADHGRIRVSAAPCRSDSAGLFRAWAQPESASYTGWRPLSSRQSQPGNHDGHRSPLHYPQNGQRLQSSGSLIRFMTRSYAPAAMPAPGPAGGLPYPRGPLCSVGSTPALGRAWCWRQLDSGWAHLRSADSARPPGNDPPASWSV
jgi:hypothetical protein